ncbi:hypothetical protein [Streptomyces sp. NPDC005955]|uniref:hypothetical protein n=1 Tax=Streptomyces sp. NPDC005955 TaxID=3364738 RepID=UPI00369EA03E
MDGSRLISDAEVFHRTTHPVAFEPDARLARLARRHEWGLADRNNLLKAVDATGLSLPPSSDGDDPERHLHTPEEARQRRRRPYS